MTALVQNSQTLRQYQSKDYAKIQEGFKTNLAVAYQAPTGSGKSVVIAQYVLDQLALSKKILFVSNRRHLQTQFGKRMNNLGVKSVETLNAKNKSAVNASVILCTIQTAISKTIIEILEQTHIDIFVVDECHHAVTASYRMVLDAIRIKNPLLKVFGVTATTNRFDLIPLEIVFDHLVLCSKSMNQMITDGDLSPYRVFSIYMEDIEKAVTSHGGDFVIKSMSAYMSNPKVIDLCVAEYKKRATDRKTLVYCVDKAHMEAMKLAFINAGFTKICAIDDKTSETKRQEYFSQFENGAIDIMLCVETLTEGLDLPECTCIMLCRGTKSMILFRQMTGRGLRPKEDGGDCLILDCAGNVERLGMPTAHVSWDLSGKRASKEKNHKQVIMFKDEDGKLHLEMMEDVPVAEMVEVSLEDITDLAEEMLVKAKKTNEQLYEEAYEKFLFICKRILEKAKIGDYAQTKTDYSIERSKNGVFTASFTVGKFEHLHDAPRINFSIGDRYNNAGKLIASTENAYHIKEYEDGLLVKSVIGDVSWAILSTITRTNSEIGEITTILEELEDIKELEDRQKQAKLDHFVHKLSAELEKNGEAHIELSRKFSLHAYNPQLSHRTGEYTLRFTKQRTILENNRIAFLRHEDDGTKFEEYFAKSVKFDRVMDIVKQYAGELV